MASGSGKTLSKHSQMQTTKTKQLPTHNSLLLKDYLRDDLSSCSSNGFKSFPRRPCCSTVGFLVEKDLKLQQRKRRSRRKTLLPRPPRSTSSSCSSSKVTVLQRASEAVINAIKSLPLSSHKRTKAKKAVAGSVLSRSFSRKLLSRSFWRKAAKEEGGEGTQRWRTSFRELLMQDRDKTASLNEDSLLTAAPGSSTASSSGCGSNSSWGESEFTFSSSSAASSSERATETDVAEGTKEAAPRQKIDEVTRDWSNEEKEQLSPVSVLDCPFEDDEGITFHFKSTTRSLLEGTEHKHLQKGRHFEGVASLKPVASEKMMALSELDDEPHNHSTKPSSVLVPVMHDTKDGKSEVLHHDKVEENTGDLLNLVKSLIPSNCLIVKAENLLFDYFKQSIRENNDINSNGSKKLELCEVAEHWIRGKPQEVYLGWEVNEGRQVYIREMDKCVQWRNSDQEVHQLVLELENEVFISLVNELVLDLTIC